MARPKGSKNKPKTDGAESGNGRAKGRGRAAGTETRHDNLAREPLTDEQLEALTASHVALYEKALNRKKLADAELKNICKVAKAEGVLLADIKAYIDAKTDEGQERLREQAERVARVAKWFKFAVQADLFDDGAPPTNRSHRLGKEAGMAGEKAVVPEDCDPTAWMNGWHEGQAALAGGIKPTPESDPAFN